MDDAGIDTPASLTDNEVHLLGPQLKTTEGAYVFKLYSKGCEYTLRALIASAPDGEVKRFRAKDVCRRSGVPEPYARKALQALAQAGLLRSVLGPGGGYELGRDPTDITLLEVIRLVDGADTFDHCLLGLPECGETQPCPLHDVWSSAKEKLLEALDSKTLQDLLNSHLKKERRKSELV